MNSALTPCASCRKNRDAADLVEGHAFLAREMPDLTSILGKFSDMQFYTVHQDEFVLPICNDCIRREIQKLYLFFGGVLLAGGLLIWLDSLLDWSAFGYVLGGILASVALGGMIKFWPNKTNLADEKAVELLRKNLPKNYQQERQVEFFTRKEKNELIALKRP